MPYIDRDRRADLAGGFYLPHTPGELNYAITRLVVDYCSRKGKSYASINDAVGALESAKLEFYRRYAAPYEDTKIQQNGDCYP